MEKPPERSKRLHNFNLPHRRWGQQRFLRYVNLSSNSHHAPSRSVIIAGASKDKLRGEVKNGEVVVAATRPWNLRTKRAVCSEPGDELVVKIIGSEFGVKRSVESIGNLEPIYESPTIG